MELKTYVFLYRRKGSFKRIPANQWRDFLDCKIALPNIETSEFKTTEIKIITQAPAARALYSIKAWQIKVDLYGFVENSHCDELPKPQLSTPLSDLFPVEENSEFSAADIQLAAYVDAMFSEPIIDSYPETASIPCGVEHFVEQICSA